MQFKATVVSLSEIDENEITISINNEILLCFLAYCPNTLELGQ